MKCHTMLNKFIFASALIFADLILAHSSAYADEDNGKSLEEWKIVRKVENVTEETEAEAVLGVISRLLPDHAQFFSVIIDRAMEVNNSDTVQVSAKDGYVQVKGSSGVAASWGVLHYLKQYCNCHISWDGDQLALPQTLPDANFTITSKDRYRYYQNVCTVSYSSVWWQWPRWEREIDWMALNGINLPLAFTGQEAVWRRVYLKLGLTDDDLAEYFAGPAFLAWNRMGNLMAWGGPLPVTYIEAQELLQKKILGRMRELGMIPVLPCFAGYVPAALTRLFPDANITRQSAWGHFNDTYTRTYMLEPLDPLFQRIGVMFMEEMKSTYNYTDGIYNCDPYNEQTPMSNEPSYMAQIGSSIYGTLEAVDADAIWLLQGWFLLNEFWTQSLAKALLTSVPKGRILVLDLAAEVTPVYNKFDSFYGQPFIFCMLNNYGGADGLFGNIDMLLENLAKARSSNTTLVGTGTTMEGINQNYIMYDFMMELAWGEPPSNVSDWAAMYALQRYGSSAPEQAWRYLIKNVYNDKEPYHYHGRHIIMMRPTLHLTPLMWYPVSDLIYAWDEMIGAANTSHLLQGPQISCYSPDEDGNETYGAVKCEKTRFSKSDELLTKQATFRHDLVDVTREVLQLFGGQVAVQLVAAYNSSSYSRVKRMGATLDAVLQDMDDLLATAPKFLLGRWTADAAALASNEQEEEQFVYNALNQITLWGPTDAQILDYAVKQWAGVIENYTRPRWQLFVAALLQSIRLNETYDDAKVNEALFKKVEEPFTLNTDAPYPYQPVGDSVATAIKMYKKYRPAFLEAGIPVNNDDSSTFGAFDANATLSKLRAVVGMPARLTHGKLPQRKRPSLSSASSPDHRASNGLVEDASDINLKNFQVFSSKYKQFFTEANMKHILEPIASWSVADHSSNSEWDERKILSNSAERRFTMK